MKKKIIILQARTGSSRLPAKVLKQIDNISVLSLCILRLKLIDKNVEVIVATSKLGQDDRIVEIAKESGVKIFRGSECDVLDRYYQCARVNRADIIFRATADNPFIDFNEARKVLNAFFNEKFAYISNINIYNGLTLPKGVGIEAFTFDALGKSWESGKEEHHREHVNDYILENPEIFTIKEIACSPENSCKELSLSIDTLEDYNFIINMVQEIGISPAELSTQRIIKWWKEKIN